MTKTSYAIALGSNRRSRHGSPTDTLRTALAVLGELGTVEAASAIVTTPALGPAGRAFANAAAIVTSALEPDELLRELKTIERRFGRRRGRRWGPRVLDLDIILWSGGAFEGGGLIVPHPEMRRRGFVLDPLGRIAPDWRDPISGTTVHQLRHRLLRPRRLTPAPPNPR